MFLNLQNVIKIKKIGENVIKIEKIIYESLKRV